MSTTIRNFGEVMSNDTRRSKGGNEMSEWISVKDKMPQPGRYVACIAKRNPFSRFMPMVARIEKNGWANPITEQYISEVTHWLPLPEPPKEGICNEKV